MRWFALVILSFLCLVGLIAGQIAYNKRVPTRGGFETKLAWACEEIPMAVGSGFYSYLRFGFNIDDPEKSEAEIKRRVMALEPYIKTPDDFRDWLSRSAIYFKYDQLIDLETRYKSRLNTELKMQILLAKCSNGMGSTKNAETRERLGQQLSDLLKQDFSGASSSDSFRSCLSEYFGLSSSRAELVKDYQRLVGEAPKDPSWRALLDDALVGSVRQDVYLHRLRGLILDEFRKNPSLPIDSVNP